MQKRQLAAAEKNLVAAQRTVEFDAADLEFREAEYKRADFLLQKGAGTVEQRDQTYALFRQSQAAHQRDQALENASERQVELAQANIHTAEENLKLSQIVLGYTVLRAPFAGVIQVRQAELGEVMVPGTPVVTLADLDHVWLRAYINETDIGKVRYGQPVTVTTDTYPGKTYHGRVSLHLLEGRIHAEERGDACRTGDAGLSNPHRHLQSDPRAGARHAGGRECSRRCPPGKS